MENARELLVALGVVEWHGALRHLEAMPREEVSDTVVDIMSGELADLCDRWFAVSGRDKPPTVWFDETAAACRAYLTDHVEELEVLLAEHE